MQATLGARSMTTEAASVHSVMQDASNADADVNLLRQLLSHECSQ